MKAYRDNLYGRRYQWIVSGLYQKDWWNRTLNDCSREQLMAALDGYIATDVLPLTSSQITDFGIVSDRHIDAQCVAHPLHSI